MLQFYLYLLIISIFGFFLLEHLRTYRESMRTLSRPVINASKNHDQYTFRPSPPYDGETLNAMIDRMIHKYFDKRGFPYSNTIELYKNLCVNQWQRYGRKQAEIDRTLDIMCSTLSFPTFKPLNILSQMYSGRLFLGQMHPSLTC